MRDTVNVLKAGLPSVVLVHEPFALLARGQLRNLGVEDVDKVLLAYPQDHPVGDPPEAVQAIAQTVAGRLEEMLIAQRWGPAPKGASKEAQ